jgi:hypothetical protein
VRIRRLSGIVMLAVGLGLAAAPTGAGAAGSAPPLVTTLQTVTDGVGDVVNTLTSSLFDNPRADITSASVEYAPGWIRMKLQVRTPTDPLKDTTWSDKNDAEWAFDTNGDGQEDYTVEFATDKGELYGAVFDATKPKDSSKCDADSASYSPQDGYTLVIDPACIGNPKTLGFAVAMFFDTNPKDDKAPVATDRVPDQGFATIAAPVDAAAGSPAPSASPPVTGALAPTAPKSGAGPAPKAGAPPAPAAGGRTALGSGTPGPGSAGSAASASGASRPTAGGAGPTSAANGAAAPGAPSTAGPTNLARTGSASEEKALLGLGLMLLGAGLLVMTRPTRRVVGVGF